MRRSIPALAAGLALIAAAPASATYREVGVPKGENLPKASCPENCQVIPRVTGYQMQAGELKNSYKINRKGYITAFTISLGKPSTEVIQGFSDVFGRPSQARLAILKRGRKKQRRTLRAQSPVYDLEQYFGSQPTFVLRKPIRVGPRRLVALTVPTWAPAFQVGLSDDYTWRAPRKPDNCDDVERAYHQQKIGATRRYRCTYRTARLLYSATFVPDPKPTTSSGEDGDRRR